MSNPNPNFTPGTAEATPPSTSSSSSSAAVPNYRMSSHEEHSAAKHAAARGGRVWRQHNAMHLSRVYPAPARVDPSNYLLWSYRLLLTVYYLPFTTYYLLLTPYYVLTRRASTRPTTSRSHTGTRACRWWPSTSR